MQLMRCQECQAVVAICDECELAWSDISATHADPHVAAVGAFPKCPHCSTVREWTVLDKDAVRQAELDQFCLAPENEREPDSAGGGANGRT